MATVRAEAIDSGVPSVRRGLISRLDLGAQAHVVS